MTYFNLDNDLPRISKHKFLSRGLTTEHLYHVLHNKTYPMDSGPWDTISFAFQGGIIAFLDINKATSLGVNSHN